MSRWIPTISMLLVSLISYIDRNTLALLAPTILRDTGLSNEQYGYVISAFSIAYMAGNPIWGVILDRYGLRWGMTAAVGFWTLASAAHGWATGFWTFAAARTLLGFGEGATFPGGLRTAVQTLPETSRARGIAVAYSGGSLGAIVTPLIVTPIAAAFGWRTAFWLTGLIGACWLCGWLAVSKDLERLPQKAEAKSTVPFRFGDTRAWAFMAAYALGGLPLAFVIYAAALYLSQDRLLTQETIGRLLWIPPLGWECGYFFWGWLADRLRKPAGIPFSPLLGAAAILSLPLAAAPAIPSTGGVVFLLFVAMFAAAGFVILSIAYAGQIFSQQQAGLTAGLGAGSWSAVVALLMPLFGRMFDGRHYQAAFVLAALAPATGYLAWRGLKAVSSSKEPEIRC